MSTMRILQICADRGIAPGSTKGAAQHLRGIAAGLLRRGHQVRTWCARPANGPFPTTVHPLHELEAVGSDGEPVSLGTVVYERYSLAHRGGLELARRLNVPFVLEVNAPLVAEAERHRPDTVGSHDADIEAALVRSADLVITVSSALTEWAGSMRSGPTVTVTNGFEPAWFPLAANPEAPVHDLVFLGHPKPWHGADRLVDLVATLARWGRRPSLLVIGGGPGADAIVDRARCAGVDEQLTVTGPLPPAEASAMVRLGGIGIAPYRAVEPFYFCPLKVVDYLAAGLPVVASDLGDIAEMVGSAGVLVDPGDDAGLAVAVVSLLEDPVARLDMGSIGRRRSMASMTWDHVAARTEAAIASVVDAAGVRA